MPVLALTSRALSSAGRYRASGIPQSVILCIHAHMRIFMGPDQFLSFSAQRHHAVVFVITNFAAAKVGKSRVGHIGADAPGEF